jgi:formylglycine-generating enzyme required for sulfatase activity
LQPADKTIILSGDVTLDLVKVEAGTFTMSARDGANNPWEVPHQVSLKKDFYLSRTEITQEQWKTVMGANPSEFKGDDLPVEQVSWNDAMSFCEKLNSMKKAPSGWMFTLPTETQWEYAARGGKKSKGYKYSGSNIIDEVAWHESNAGFTTSPVGLLKANELGFYDMNGNVYEWCLDDWNEDSSKQTAEFARGNSQVDSDRVIRGGGWTAADCRLGSRSWQTPGERRSNFGFRIALVQTTENDSVQVHRNGI